MTVAVVHCRACGFCGPVLHAHPGLAWQTFFLALTGIGLLPLLLAMVLQSSGTRRSCAACLDSDAIEAADQLVTAEAQAVWQRAVQRDAQVHRRQVRVLGLCLLLWLGVVATVASVSLPRIAAWLGWSA